MGEGEKEERKRLEGEGVGENGSEEGERKKEICREGERRIELMGMLYMRDVDRI